MRRVSKLSKIPLRFFIVAQVTGSLAAIAAGTSFGVFTLGILFPWTNTKVRNKCVPLTR